jgi:allophanate hydrolase subunit 1
MYKDFKKAFHGMLHEDILEKIAHLYWLHGMIGYKLGTGYVYGEKSSCALNRSKSDWIKIQKAKEGAI